MIPEWLAICLVVFAYALGWVDATARAKEDESPFWRGYRDIRTFRAIWRK